MFILAAIWRFSIKEKLSSSAPEGSAPNGLDFRLLGANSANNAPNGGLLAPLGALMHVPVSASAQCLKRVLNEKSGQRPPCLARGVRGCAPLEKEAALPPTVTKRERHAPLSFCDPLGARTQDPSIKSAVLYQLS